MLSMVVRKILRNRWLASCLVAGTVLAVALVSSIPMYTSGVLQRVLTRDLELFQEQASYFAGRYTVYGSVAGTPADPRSWPALDPEIRGRVAELGLPVLSEARLIGTDYLEARYRGERAGTVGESRFVKLEAITGAEDHVRILRGRLWSPDADVLEVIVNEQALARRGLELERTYVLAPGTVDLEVRVVGVYDAAETRDLWWFQSPGAYDGSLLADFDRLRAMIADPPTAIGRYAMWSYALDYHAITLANLERVTSGLRRQLGEIDSAGLRYDTHMLPILDKYTQRRSELVRTLWFLQVPVLAMLAFYVYMVSLLITDREANEIALLKSRGASGRQIFLTYAVESALYSGVGILAGPPLGLLVCRVMGASNGFLQFVQRSPLDIRLSPAAYLFAAVVALFLTLTTLIPALGASRATIVIHKQRRARRGKPAWRRYGLDLVLIALTGLGWWAWRWRKVSLALVPTGGAELPLDPLLFIVSVAFVLGVGLLFLRVYPLALRLVFRAGRGIWPTSLYATFVGVSRSGGYEHFIMLFLILTLSVGILNARSARTINRNVDETIRYDVGADITLREHWPTNEIPVAAGPPPPGAQTASGSATELLYFEPDFARYLHLDGVQEATRVFRSTGAFATLPDGGVVKVTLLGIVPDEFSRVAWFRPGMLGRHPNEYLNALAQSPNALIVSESLAAKHHLELGDALNVTWAGQGFLDGIVSSRVPYWPTYNPYADETGEITLLVVANLTYVQAKMATEPYEVWIRKADGATSARVYDALEQAGVEIAALEDATPLLLAARNDPLLQGTNGALSMGFAVTMAMTTIGYLIYWIISLEGRTLQFGVLRAMGLKRRALVTMIGWEQVLVSLAAVAMGVVIGGVAADLYVPLLELARPVPRVPPFAVTAAGEDYIRLYTIVGITLSLALGVVALRISRIRVAEAVKLGED